MSGVNGGIDYELRIDALPSSIRDTVAHIVDGPDSPMALIDAMRRITAFVLESGADEPSRDDIMPVLVDALGYNNPISANMAVDALVDAYGRRAVPMLLRGVAAFNYAVNAYALRALARIGDPSVAEVARTCALKGPIPNVRRAAIRCLGALRYNDWMDVGGDDDNGDGDGSGRETATATATRCEAVARAADALLQLMDDSDWSVRYAAISSTERLVRGDARETVRARFVDKLRQMAAADPDEVVRARAALSRP